MYGGENASFPVLDSARVYLVIREGERERPIFENEAADMNYSELQRRSGGDIVRQTLTKGRKGKERKRKGKEEEGKEKGKGNFPSSSFPFPSPFDLSFALKKRIFAFIPYT